MQDGIFIYGLFQVLIVIFQGLNLTEKNWEDVLNLTTFIHPECGAFPDIVRVKVVNYDDIEKNDVCDQGCISCGTCSYPELTDDHVLTSAYVKSFRIVTRNAVNKSF